MSLKILFRNCFVCLSKFFFCWIRIIEFWFSFDIFFSLSHSVTEAKNFNRETISERFEKSINRQSSKPFSIFYNRLSDNQKFVEQYNPLKCQK